MSSFKLWLVSVRLYPWATVVVGYIRRSIYVPVSVSTHNSRIIENNAKMRKFLFNLLRIGEVYISQWNGNTLNSGKMSLGPCQGTTQTNVELLSTSPLGTNSSLVEINIYDHKNDFVSIRCNMLDIVFRRPCVKPWNPARNVLFSFHQTLDTYC